MAELIITVSGLRGIVGESLTPEVAKRYACALASTLPDGPIVITQDGRESGPMLAAAIGEGLTAMGRRVIDAGVAATPTTGVLIRQYSAAGGIQISASHNPAPYNGMKLFSSAGSVLTEAAGRNVLNSFHSTTPFLDAPGETVGTVEQIGETVACDDPLGEHLALVLACVDVPKIQNRKLNVLLDANHGAGGALGRQLLEALGCQVAVLGEVPNGRFAHPPEPTAENLASVLSQVAAAGADVGFCQDPDADRLALIDENGRYLGEEYTLALCVDHVLKTRKGAIVTNCSSSRMSQDLAEQYGVPFVRSKVGEANVVEQMQAHDAVLGGEGNGGVIDPRVGFVRDSFIGMALLLEALAETDKPLSALADAMPRYAMVKTKIALPPERVDAGLTALQTHFADATPDRLDGLRLDWPDRWLLVRASNTEPIVRAIAEAKTPKIAQALCDQAAQILASNAHGAPTI